MDSKVYTLQNIKYVKDDGCKSVRTVIPTFIPQNNMRAIDVTECDDETRAEMLTLLSEYAEYVQGRQKLIYNFEDWMEHTHELTGPVKWRTFKLDNTSFLTE